MAYTLLMHEENFEVLVTVQLPILRLSALLDSLPHYMRKAGHCHTMRKAGRTNTSRSSNTRLLMNLLMRKARKRAPHAQLVQGGVSTNWVGRLITQFSTMAR